MEMKRYNGNRLEIEWKEVALKSHHINIGNRGSAILIYLEPLLPPPPPFIITCYTFILEVNIMRFGGHPK